jgi:putative ABC transport system ATP-binding protein
MTEFASPVVGLQSASRSYRTAAVTVAALTDVSLEIRSGELVGVAGPSGSGKTTLLNLIVGWDQPDAGAVTRDLGPGAGWTAMAVVPQELGLIPELTAAQNVSMARRLGGCDRIAPADLFARLGLVGLESRLPDELSVGEQQRTAVARALTCSPALLVADEPTAHQDEYHADQVMALLAERAANGGAVLVATHDDRMLARVDRVVHLLDGKLVASDSRSG